MKLEISKLKKSEIVWLSEHNCKHGHNFLQHFSCYKGQTEPTVAFFDTEVTPQESYTYGPMHEAKVIKIKKYQHLICFSYLDFKTGKTKVVALNDFPLYKREPDNDREVAKALHKILSEYDYVVAHNIKFDVGIAKARFIKHKLPTLKKLNKICTLQLARKVANFPANSLKELAIFLDIEHKKELDKGVWDAIVERRDSKAWKKMKSYNRTDSIVGKKIFDILNGWSDVQLIK